LRGTHHRRIGKRISPLFCPHNRAEVFSPTICFFLLNFLLVFLSSTPPLSIPIFSHQTPPSFLLDFSRVTLSLPLGPRSIALFFLLRFWYVLFFFFFFSKCSYQADFLPGPRFFLIQSFFLPLAPTLRAVIHLLTFDRFFSLLGLDSFSFPPTVFYLHFFRFSDTPAPLFEPTWCFPHSTVLPTTLAPFFFSSLRFADMTPLLKEFGGRCEKVPCRSRPPPYKASQCFGVLWWALFSPSLPTWFLDLNSGTPNSRVFALVFPFSFFSPPPPPVFFSYVPIASLVSLSCQLFLFSPPPLFCP